MDSLILEELEAEVAACQVTISAYKAATSTAIDLLEALVLEEDANPESVEEIIGVLQRV